MPVFSPFRALGYVSADVPFAVQRRGTETFVTVAVGRAWQLFNVAKLRLVLVGPELPKAIRALAAVRDLTFAAYGNDVAVFSRAHQVGVLRGHTAPVVQLLPFGDSLLVSIAADRTMMLWAVAVPTADAAPSSHPNAAAAAGGAAAGGGGGSVWVQQPMRVIDFGEGFTPTCVMHPDTYLNKVLVGSEEGRLQLWNVNSGALVHEFGGWGSPVRCVAGSPALDTVAVGCADGRVRVCNLRYDHTIMTFAHSPTPDDANSGGGVTAVSFRTDGQQAWLVAGGLTGEVTVWDLEKRRLKAVVREAHDARVVSLLFLPTEPVLMSLGADNSLKMWIFDNDDGEARLLRHRTGHSAPPSCIEFYGNGRHILSAGHDRAFRVFSTIQDHQSRELSQGHVAKKAKRWHVKEEELKLPPVVALDSSEVRERDWCNVVTCHAGHTTAYLWRLKDYAIGSQTLKPPGKKTTHAAAVACAMSACGNFATVGYADGRVRQFNVQSGLLRRSFRRARDHTSTAHAGAVTGVATDLCNHVVVSTGIDGCIRVWNMRTGRMKASRNVGVPIASMDYHRASDLLAIATADLSLAVYDVASSSSSSPSPSSSSSTQPQIRCVRRFPSAHAGKVTALRVASDGRWLLSAGMDSTLRVWDVVRGCLLDSVRVAVAVTGLSLSPTMDMLATTHSGLQGIYLWTNKAMYAGLDDADVAAAVCAATATGTATLSTATAAAAAEAEVALPCLVGPEHEAEEKGEDGQGPKTNEQWGWMPRAAAASETAPLRATGQAGDKPADYTDMNRDVASRAGTEGGSTHTPRHGDNAEGVDAEGVGGAEGGARVEPKAAATATAAVSAPATVVVVPGLVSRALLPRSLWMGLVHLDTIKERNRPIEPPKKPAAAPFFLPTAVAASAAAGRPVFKPLPNAAAAADHDDAAATSAAAISAAARKAAGGGMRQANVADAALDAAAEDDHDDDDDDGADDQHNPLLRAIRRGFVTNDYAEAAALLRRLSPSAIDLELRTLEIVDDEPSPAEVAALLRCVAFLRARLASKQDFELTHAVTARFLAIHGEALSTIPQLKSELPPLVSAHAEAWDRMDDLLQSVRCMASFIMQA